MNSKYLSILLSATLISQIGINSSLALKDLNNNKNYVNKDENTVQSQYINLNNENNDCPEYDLEEKIKGFEKLLDKYIADNNLFTSKEIDIICNESIQYLKYEPCLLNINEPVIIVGDIHGDIKSLEFCIKKFLNEVQNGKSILFLGDYVDRGKNSVECSTLLLKLKTVFPDKVYLLRGNHEIKRVKSKSSRERYVTSKYGFLSEVRTKYNKDHVFEKLNETFDYLSIVAIINNSAFCVHGGISPELNNLEQISTLKKPISYEELSEKKNKNIEELVMDLLWSDPGQINNFEANKKRGRGKLFGHEQTINFLKKFNLEHIIRGHQCCDNGYDDKFGDESLITIFSVPNYVSKTNKGAIITYINKNNFSYENICI